MSENVNRDQAEYNAFGPWAYEISDKNPVPPLFEPFFTADDGAIMKIKVPREIERRNAEPGMNLYDFVIALYEDRLVVLERQDNTVKEHEIALKDLASIRIYKILLKGGYTVYSDDDAISFPFNAISTDVFEKLTDLILERLPVQAGSAASLPVTDTVSDVVFLRNMLHDIQLKTPDICVGAVQKGMDVHKEGSTSDRIVRLLWRESNPPALHLYTDKCLLIVENGIFPNQAGMEDYGYSQTYIPFNRISGVEITDSAEYSQLKECTLSVGENRFTYHFAADNDEVAAFYNALK